MTACLCAACGAPSESERCEGCGAPALLDGRYRLTAILGHGASATVYRAERLEDGVEVAIKELLLVHSEGAGALARDAELLAGVRHPGVPRVLESFALGEGRREVRYVVQELARGESLAEAQARGRGDARAVFSQLAEVLDILAYLHAHHPPIVHRDVKPENIVRRADGSLVLVDFGSAALERDVAPNTMFTASGTIGYMPVEQIAGVVRPANDVYAAGALAVALLTRKHPAELLSSELHLEWERLVTLHPAQLALLRRMVAVDPDARPSTLDAASEARRVAGLDPHAARGRSPLALIAIAIAAALGAVALGATASDEPPPAKTAPPPKPPPVAVAPPAPPPPSSPLVGSEYEWRCDELDSRVHRYQRLPPGPGRCADDGECADLAAGFEGLDHDALCEITSDRGAPGVVVRSEDRFEHTLNGETASCVRRIDPFRCTITCWHPEGQSQDALRERFERHLRSVRDRYGPERDASIQGVRFAPRRQHRWTGERVFLELELDQNLCCTPGARDCMAQLRTRYSRSLR